MSSSSTLALAPSFGSPTLPPPCPHPPLSPSREFGLALSFTNRSPALSTPCLSTAATALQLLPQVSSISSTPPTPPFAPPSITQTDMLLPNQLLPISSLLTSTTDANDPILTDYCLLITNNDVVMQWAATSQLYWSISSDARSIKCFNLQIAFLSINATCIYILTDDQKTALF
ncbi:hypothetical protein ZIOFF_067697 [Zingiber officinale]|uniref:Uncharacterized protein n=1 Tax=Zingiber officinale TaxID=94328 RepID=A0A8J5ESX5_ZINOF|nr:hypothetical protein ZIOFF_067697 [Zingiber officinale]